MIKHTIEPFYNENSEILILGSMPSVKSRIEGFYYAHPQNRFWKVLSLVYKESIGETILEKKSFLNKHHIALFDVIASCDILGSSDASIKNVKINNISKIIKETHVKKIYLNGKKASTLYNRYLKDKLNIESICLPSTSPANANYSLLDLVNAYQVLNNSNEM